MLISNIRYLILLLILTFWTYYPSLNNSFLWLWDDLGYIGKNQAIWQIDKTSLLWMFSSLHMGNWHPLTWLSHAVDIQWFGLEPRGHHVINLCWHLANTLLVFLVIQRLLHYQSINSQIAIKTALLTATIFAIHPQHVESVAWISERKDLLSLFFMLASFYQYMAYVKYGKKRAYIIALIFAVAATLSKPMAVTLPVLLWFFDMALQRQLQWRMLWDKLPFFALSIGLIAITLYAQQQGQAIANLQQVDLAIRLLNGFNNPIFYIQKFLLPIPLVPFYPFPSQISWQLYLGSSATLLISLLAIIIYRRAPYLLWAWGFYLVSLSPVMGIIQVGSQAAADRYTYLPLLPIYLLFSFGFVKLIYLQTRRVFSYSLSITALMVILLLSVASRQQTIIWANDYIFWRYNVINYPDSAFSQMNLGHVYRYQHDWQQASQHYQYGAQLSYDPKIFYYWLQTLQQLDDHQQILAVYPQLPPLNPSQKSVFAHIYTQSVRALWQQTDLINAKKALKYAQILAPQSPQVLLLQQNLGRYLK